jgi:Na+-driven multidrug efflux pump
MRYIVIFVLILIVASLGSALRFMLRDEGQGERMVKALTIRVALSIGLFLLLMVGYFLGLIPRDGL